MTKKKILVLFTDVGQGHKKIAFNIAAAIKEDGHEVVLENILQVEKGVLSERGTQVYLYIINKIPRLWSFFYLNKIFLAATIPFRKIPARFNNKRIRKILEKDNYDIVICTQITASTILSYLKEKSYYKNKLVTTFSDYHLHRFWIYKNVDMFFANIQEQKNEMVSLGYDPEKIIIAGMTLPPKKEISKSEARAKLGINENEKTVLVFGGSLGYGFDKETVVQVSEVCGQVVIVCGNNKNLYEKLRYDFSGNQKMKIFGFVENMSEIYAAVDLVVSKPGGLSTAECLQWGLPLVGNSYMPGQEELNFDFLMEHSLILDGKTNLKEVVQKELLTGDFAKKLQENPQLHRIVGDGKNIREAIQTL